MAAKLLKQHLDLPKRVSVCYAIQADHRQQSCSHLERT